MSRVRFRLLSLAIVAANLALHVRVLPLALGRYRNVEETYRAHVAWMAMHGIPMGWGSLVYGAYEQGSLATSALLVPVFAALGPTVLATKLVALTWAAAKMLVFIALATRMLGPRAGLAASALAALVPPGIALREAGAMGDIQDAQLLVYAQWWAWLALRERPPAAPAWRRSLAFGVLGGASLAYALATLPSIALALALWPVKRARAAVREAGWVALGFAVALTPVVANWRINGVAFLAWRGRPLAELVDLSSAPYATLALVTGPFLADALALHPLAPPAPGYRWLLAAHRCSLAALALAWITVLTLAVRSRRARGAGSLDPVCAIVALQAAYLLAFASSSERQHYWLFLLVPTGALVVTRAAAALVRTGTRGRTGAGALIAAYIALPAAAWWQLPPSPGPGPVWSQIAHRAEHWGTPLVAGKLLVADADGVRGHAPITLDEAWGTGILLGGASAPDATLAVVARNARAPVARRFAAGVGYSRGWGRAGDDPRDFAAACPFDLEPLRAAALHGYGQATGEALGRFDLAALEALSTACPADARALARGLGDGLGFGFWHLPAGHTGPFVPDALWDDFRRGLLDRLTRDFPRSAGERALLLPRLWAAPPEPIAPSETLRIGGASGALGAFGADDADDAPHARARFELDTDAGGLYGVWVLGGASTAEVLRLEGPGRCALELSLLSNRRERLGWVYLGAVALQPGRIALELVATGATPRVRELAFVPGDPHHD